MIGYLLTYTFPNLPNTDRARIYRKLFGYDDSSKYGNYEYKRAGILSKMNYYKPHESTLLFCKKEECKQVINYLKALGAILFSRQVILTAKDRQKLNT